MKPWFILLAERLGISPKRGYWLERLVSECMMEALSNGHEVRLPCLGKLSSKLVKSHHRRINSTGEVVLVEPYVKVRFKQFISSKKRLLEKSPVAGLLRRKDSNMILREDMPSSGRSDVENLSDPSRWKILFKEEGKITLTDGSSTVVVSEDKLDEFLKEKNEGRRVLEE